MCIWPGAVGWWDVREGGNANMMAEYLWCDDWTLLGFVEMRPTLDFFLLNGNGGGVELY